MKKIWMLFFVLLLLGGGIYFFSRKQDFNNQVNKKLLKRVVKPTSFLGETKTDEQEKTNEAVEENLSLEIDSPSDKITVNNSQIIISGQTKPGVEIFVNDKELKADAAGKFSVAWQLQEGENEIVVVANDDQGNYAEKTITVYLETEE